MFHVNNKNIDDALSNFEKMIQLAKNDAFNKYTQNNNNENKPLLSDMELKNMVCYIVILISLINIFLFL